MLAGKKILVGITGSIAAYKSVYLVRLLIKAGAEVKVIMTPSAKDFVSPLTLSTLSRNPVIIDLFDEQSWANHVMLGRGIIPPRKLTWVNWKVSAIISSR